MIAHCDIFLPFFLILHQLPLIQLIPLAMRQSGLYIRPRSLCFASILLVISLSNTKLVTDCISCLVHFLLMFSYHSREGTKSWPQSSLECQRLRGFFLIFKQGHAQPTQENMSNVPWRTTNSLYSINI